MSIYIQDGLAYRASGVIWVLTDVTTAITLPFLMLAAARGGEIAGFTGAEIVSYYVVMLLVSSLTQSHFMWEIGEEIREGIFSSQIIRPMSWYQFLMARNLAWRLVRTLLFLPFGVGFLFLFREQLGATQFSFSWEGWVLLILGHLVSVMFVVPFGLIALYTQETESLFNLYYFPMLFLSGRMFPVAVFPQWVQVVAEWTPFYYSVGAPTEAFLGKLTGADAVRVMGIQLIWIAVCFVAYKWIWARGMRRYTGVGM